jgi:hypothetical protein
MSAESAPLEPSASTASRDAASQAKGGGYGQPPPEQQFQKGVSGNPSGRPPGRQNAKTIVERVLSEKVQVRDGNKTRTMTKYEAMLQSQSLKAIQGDTRAANFVQMLINQTGSFADNDGEIDSGLSKQDSAILEDFMRRSADALVDNAVSKTEVH